MIKKLICLCLSIFLMYGNSFAQVFIYGEKTPWTMAEVLETKGYIPSEGFYHYIPKERIFNPWEMTVYADDINDLRVLLNKILPYLQYLDVDHKISLNVASVTGDIQTHKGITIHFLDEDKFRRIAVDLDRIIYDNKLQKTGTNIYGMAPLGRNGRIFYGGQRGSGYFLSNEIYSIPEGHYLPKGMDDPFSYMNNLNGSLQAGYQKIKITTLDDLSHLNYLVQGNKMTLGPSFKGFDKYAEWIDDEQLLFTRKRADVISIKNKGINPVQINGKTLKSGDVYLLNAQEKKLSIYLPSKVDGHLGFHQAVTVDLKPYQLRDMRPNKITAIQTNRYIIGTFCKRVTDRLPKLHFEPRAKGFLSKVFNKSRGKIKAFAYLGPVIALALLLYANRDKNDIQSISLKDIEDSITAMQGTDTDTNDVATVLAFSDPDYEMLINKSPSLLSKQMAIAEGLNKELEDNIVDAITSVANQQAALDVEDEIINGINEYENKA